MRYLFYFFLSFCCLNLASKAQTYTPKVSKDSLGVLFGRLEILKASLKLNELKIKEAEEEADVEKLRLKLLDANNAASESNAQELDATDKLNAGKMDIKAAEKIKKRAITNNSNATKALERFNKQIEKVEDIRTQIMGEERKLAYKKPAVIYNYE